MLYTSMKKSVYLHSQVLNDSIFNVSSMVESIHIECQISIASMLVWHTITIIILAIQNNSDDILSIALCTVSNSGI